MRITGLAAATTLLALAAAGCGTGTGGDGADAATSGSAIGSALGAEGVCQATCPRSCDGDGDCNTELGELCCDYGDGKACALAGACPTFCADDLVCQASGGQTCATTSLAPGAQRRCADAGAALQFCSGDEDCPGTPGDPQVCCTNYDQPICTDRARCPDTCRKDSDCDAFNGEVCCGTVQVIEPSLKVASLCVNPATQPCPTTCTSSSQCEGTAAPLCCNGLCAATCARTCTQDSECSGQICCKSPTLSLAQPPVLFAEAPACAGVAPATCANCLAQDGACDCLGCTFDGFAGNCLGTPPVTSCDECESLYTCSPGYCPGCTFELAPVCTGGPTVFDCADCQTVACTAACLGCTTADGGACASVVASCSLDIDEPECNEQPGCSWGVPTCYGTVYPCGAATVSSTCVDQPGCQWISGGSGSCVGTPTPCSFLSTAPNDAGVSPCSAQSGCFVPGSPRSDAAGQGDGGAAGDE